MDKYIQPKIKVSKSFKKLIKDQETYGSFEFQFGEASNFSEISGIQKAFVLAEPGYGKTRCLKELAIQSQIPALFLDVKKAREKEIDEFIKENISYTDKTEAKNFDAAKSDFFTNRNFSLDKSGILVCLDALDEVNQNTFSQVAENIKIFSKKYKNVTIYVSCRIHFFKKYSELFELDNFSYVKIAPLFQPQIEEFLLTNGLTKKQINQIIHLLDFKRDLIIQTPRYLKFLVEYISEKGVSSISSLKISELFEFFIYRKLETENKKYKHYSTIQINTIKRVLEKLALVMEIYQVNQIIEDDLMTFFDDINSSLTLNFLQSSPQKFFFERGIVKGGFNKELGNYFEFENTEFQEYLASKEISRLGNLNRTLYSLCIDNELKEVYPSWCNTLRFAINRNPHLLSLILNLKNIGGRSIPVKEYHSFITKIDPSSLDNATRRSIFSEVFHYYRKTPQYLDIDIIHNLAYFFDSSFSQALKDVFTLDNGKNVTLKILEANVIRLIDFILERNIFDTKEIEYWRNALLNLSLNKNKDEDVRGISLVALKSFNDKEILGKIRPILSENKKELTKEVVNLYGELDPDSPSTMDVLAEGVKNECYIESLGFIFRKNLNRDMVFNFIDYLKKDKELVSVLLDKERIFDKDINLFCDELEKIFDDDIYHKVIPIIKNSFSEEGRWAAERSLFIRNLVKIASNHNNDFLIELLEEIRKDKELQKNIFGFQGIFSITLSVGNLIKAAKNLKKIKHGNKVLLWSLFSIKDSRRNVFAKGEKIFQKEYAEYKKAIKESNKEQALYEDQDKKRLDRRIAISLKEIRNKNTQTYHFDSLVEYLRIRENKNNFVTKQQEKQLKNICKFIFNKFDPQTAKITIVKKGKQVKYHSWINPFGIALEVSDKLNATDIVNKKIRKRFINFIPFAYENHLKSIFNLIGDIQGTEIESLFKQRKKDVKNDKWRFRIRTIIEVISKFDIKGHESLIKSFVTDEYQDLYDRKYALKAIEKIQPRQNRDYLEKIFNDYKNKRNDEKQLAEKANELLIVRYLSAEAIKWRISEIKKREFPYIRPEGMHSISDREHELDSKKFASPIISTATLRPAIFLDDILKLLGTSLRIFEKGKEFFAYAGYLWDIAFEYLEKQKFHRTYDPIYEFEKFIQNNSSKEGINFISSRLQRVKAEYANFIGKPVEFSECIKTYNFLKKNKFQPISNTSELYDFVVKIICNGIKDWIIEEGALKYIKNLPKKGEAQIQKNLLVQLKYLSLREGFLDKELLFRREEELYDDTRTDYLISYGFIGPLLIEIKRSDNNDVTNKRYRTSKLLKYMKGTNSEYCIFLIFKIFKKESLECKVKKAKKIYQKDLPYVRVIGIDCVGSEGLIS